LRHQVIEARAASIQFCLKRAPESVLPCHARGTHRLSVTTYRRCRLACGSLALGAEQLPMPASSRYRWPLFRVAGPSRDFAVMNRRWKAILPFMLARKLAQQVRPDRRDEVLLRRLQGL